jgi:dienelactone hydrolase
MRSVGIARPGLIAAAVTLLLAACVMVPPPSAPPPAAPQDETPAQADSLPPAVEYDLGETTIVQERFPEDSRFRNMPVRLNGLIALPEAGGRHPVVVIFHGNHRGCPVDEMGVDRWPCAPEMEQPNYRGFEYLVRRLAAEGFVALSININAENTFGFGEPTPGERLRQLLDRHLQALASAAAGGPNDFGVELAGRADVRRLALFGHSRGGEAAFVLANSPERATASRGYGPVAGVLLIAAATVTADPWTGSAVPLATVLSACDGDVVAQDGQFFYEGARLAPRQTQWATSVWLERANHNYFNELLPDDAMGRFGRPDCQPILDAEVQRAWLADFAGDFLLTLFSQDRAAVAEAAARMGTDVQQPAPDRLYDLPARVATLASAAERQTVILPASAAELDANLRGGAVTADHVTVHFCPKSFYNALTLPGTEPCRRNYVTVPGQPSHAVVSWDKPGAALRFTLPEGAGDLSRYTTLSLRAAVDPVSLPNPAGRSQAFTVRLTDAAGHSATGVTRAAEPALQFPPGLLQDDEVLPTGFFTGLVPLTTIRLPLSAFAGVDLTEIRELALVFDRTPTGTLFLGDVEWVRPPSG